MSLRSLNKSVLRQTGMSLDYRSTYANDQIFKLCIAVEKLLESLCGCEMDGEDKVICDFHSIGGIAEDVDALARGEEI